MSKTLQSSPMWIQSTTMTDTIVEKEESSAHKVLQLSNQMYNRQNGQNLLHFISNPPPSPSNHSSSSSSSCNVNQNLSSLLLAAQCLLERAQEMTNSTLQQPQSRHVPKSTQSQSLSINHVEQFLSQADYESGYTPLHWAIYQRNLSVILLLLRFPNTRLLDRPMNLLFHPTSSHTLHSNTTTKNGVKTTKPTSSINHPSTGTTFPNHCDYEGYTPFQLLSSLQITKLQQIRQSLLVPTIKRVFTQETKKQPKHRIRASSFSIQDNSDDDDDDNFQNNPSPNTTTYNDDNTAPFSFACEVMSFGAAHHPALGVSDTTKQSHQTHHPQRWVPMALSHRRDDPAVQVVAATHHTLVRTQRGHVLSCGLGKGGRLGHGQEQNSSFPQPIVGFPMGYQIIHIAASENHSLAVTQYGTIYGWGSNRFGQVDPSLPSTSIRCTPTRVDFKYVNTVTSSSSSGTIIAVAAGERHSVALTQIGEVYTWGDNSWGQLGRLSNKSDIQRVESLWKYHRVVQEIDASEQSTLVLVRPQKLTGALNVIYTWGHGNPHPIQIKFLDSVRRSETSAASKSPSFLHPRVPNPIHIACAKHNCAAITDDGRVYNFGIRSESLKSSSSLSPSSTSTPSLVVASPVPGMEDQTAVAVSASDHHIAVVTATGHLYTWGSSTDNHVLGHEGRKWQPSPKQVPGVHRAVAVAVAKEHTVLLLGTCIPNIPTSSCCLATPSLEYLAGRIVCQHVDIFNVIPIIITANRMHCTMLQEYCKQFIQENLDAVLAYARKSELDVYLKECLADSRVVDVERDRTIHPWILESLQIGKTHAVWKKECSTILEAVPVSMWVRYDSNVFRNNHNIKDLSSNSQSDSKRVLHAGSQGCSDRILHLIANCQLSSNKNVHEHNDNTNTCDDELLRTKHASLSKEIRSIQKRLTQTAKLGSKTTITALERDKLNRKPLWEADLTVLTRAIEQITKRMAERNIAIESKSMAVATTTSAALSCTKESRDDTIPNSEFADITKGVDDKDSQKSEILAHEDITLRIDLYCDICSVRCPDSNHLELHRSGRKHRNRVRQLQEEEQNRMAQDIISLHQQQLQHQILQGSKEVHDNSISQVRSTADTCHPTTISQDYGVQPRYRLPSPSIPPAPIVSKNQSPWSSQSTVSQSKSLSTILQEEEAAKADEKTKKSTKIATAKTCPKISLRSKPLIRNVSRDAATQLCSSSPTSSNIKLVSPSCQTNQFSSKANPNATSSLFFTPPKSKPSPNSHRTLTESRNTSTQKLLHDFLPKSPSTVTLNSPTTPIQAWKQSTPSMSTASTASTNQTTPKLTILEIQQLEATKKQRQHQPANVSSSISKDSKWYQGEQCHVESLSTIQQQEERRRIVIEQQLAIERQINEEQQKLRQQKNLSATTPNKDAIKSQRQKSKTNSHAMKCPPKTSKTINTLQQTMPGDTTLLDAKSKPVQGFKNKANTFKKKPHCENKKSS